MSTQRQGANTSAAPALSLALLETERHIWGVGQFALSMKLERRIHSMAVYTYEVDHGDNPPRVYAGMTLNGGTVTAVQFDAALAENERMAERIAELEHTRDMLLKQIDILKAKNTHSPYSGDWSNQQDGR